MKYIATPWNIFQLFNEYFCVLCNFFSLFYLIVYDFQCASLKNDQSLYNYFSRCNSFYVLLNVCSTAWGRGRTGWIKPCLCRSLSRLLSSIREHTTSKSGRISVAHFSIFYPPFFLFSLLFFFFFFFAPVIYLFSKFFFFPNLLPMNEWNDEDRH